MTYYTIMTSSTDLSGLKSTSTLVNNLFHDETNEDKHAQNMKILVELKFALEKEITILSIILKRVNQDICKMYVMILIFMLSLAYIRVI